MTYQPSTFPSELGIATRVGLTRGVGGSGPGLRSFAEAEMHYRETRLREELARSRRREQAREGRRSARLAPPARTRRARRSTPSRWATWLPSIGLRRASVAAQSRTNVCSD